MLTSISGYNPISIITSDLIDGDEDYHTLHITMRHGTRTIAISVDAESREMQALFAAIHSAISMPALIRPLDEIDAEAAEYEETRKVAVCEECGQAHG